MNYYKYNGALSSLGIKFNTPKNIIEYGIPIGDGDFDDPFYIASSTISQVPYSQNPDIYPVPYRDPTLHWAGPTENNTQPVNESITNQQKISIPNNINQNGYNLLDPDFVKAKIRNEKLIQDTTPTSISTKRTTTSKGNNGDYRYVLRDPKWTEAELGLKKMIRETNPQPNSSTTKVTPQPTRTSAQSSNQNGQYFMDWLKANRPDLASYQARKAIAAQYGIQNYTGSAAQNMALWEKLRRPIENPSIHITNEVPLLNVPQPSMEIKRTNSFPNSGGTSNIGPAFENYTNSRLNNTPYKIQTPNYFNLF